MCLDAGSTTQDVLWLDTGQPIENAVQMILPAPTVIAAGEIEAAARFRKNVVLIGETAGGGACTSAVKRHLESGLQVYAEANAARTFDDDLDEVVSWGVQIIPDGEWQNVKNSIPVALGDLDLEKLKKALSVWNVEFNPDVVCVAVLDHGVAPKGESDRLWRFKYLERLLHPNRMLEALTYSKGEIPPHFSRMQAVARSFNLDAPLVLMDTGAAAVTGVCLDAIVAGHENRLAVNLGNSHTLAFNLLGNKVLGFFEHHTAALTLEHLENLLEQTAAGTLQGKEIRDEGGHGGLIYEKGVRPFLAVTGPRRSKMAGSRLAPYFASPYGSMMLTGCYGLLKAAVVKVPQYRDELEAALKP